MPHGRRVMVNALTIDVEDYFQVTAFEKSVSRAAWGTYPLRVERNTGVLLDLLDERSVKATFFILGWVAERLPGLAKQIHTRGHEIACHGFGHERIYTMNPGNFREDVRHAKRLLEDQCGVAVLGYRAPSFSVTAKSLWALDILLEEGFIYDSSIFPIHHDLYGMPGANPFPHEIRRPAGILKEFPPTTAEFSLLGKRFRVPVAGGGYLRLFPLRFIRRAIEKVNERYGQPAVIYIHPWEIDPGQPRIKAGLKSRFRHYVHLDQTLGKVRSLISALQFAPMSQVLGLQGVPRV